jgi:hypothetical protein
MNRGQLPARLLPTRPVGDGPERMSGRNTVCRNTITHHVADPEPHRAECRSKPGRPRTYLNPTTRSRTPTAHKPSTDHQPPLDTQAGTSKQ